MSTTEVFLKSYEFNRARTLDLLSKIEQLPDPQAVLAWRPGVGRAHIGWQLLHVAITEEMFATERLLPEKPRAYEELWPRFRGGSTPDSDVPSAEFIRTVLSDTRQHLIETVQQWGDTRLDEIPAALQARGWTFQDVLALLGWHEAHHQGQAHLTLNLYQQAHS